MTDFFDKGFWQGLATSFVYTIICWAGAVIKRQLSKNNPLNFFIWNRAFIGGVFVAWMIINTFVLFYSLNPARYKFLLLSIVLTTFVTWIFVWRELSQFLSVGLLRADKKAGTGFGYDQALKLCQNHLNFLGIGAAKLTGSIEFEGAIRRCHRDTVPVRFLLAHPDNPLLIEAAQRKGVDQTEYKRKVENSLKVISELKLVKQLNIEVCFYSHKLKSDFPLFRLMFINDSICLFSYNIFGEGDGSQLPQLHLTRSDRKRDTNSFYYPFREFFNRLWEESSQWDFQFPIK